MPVVVTMLMPMVVLLLMSMLVVMVMIFMVGVGRVAHVLVPPSDTAGCGDGPQSIAQYAYECTHTAIKCVHFAAAKCGRAGDPL